MVRFGFGGSTGGSRNIHEIMCFQASPQNSAASSAGLNQKQTAKVQTGTQVYFAFYNPNNWTGSMTSQYLDSADGVNLQIDPIVNWDASCNLTGVPGGADLRLHRRARTHRRPRTRTPGRVMLTYNDATVSGIPFTWSGAGATPLSAGEQAKLDYFRSDPASSAVWPFASNLRLEYLRGQRGDEQNRLRRRPRGLTAGRTPGPAPRPPAFAPRTSVLGDIIDSSPTWVGAPDRDFPAIWSDYLYPATAMPENSGPTYATFKTEQTSRMNVVYAGANDGFMHGFRTGFFDANGPSTARHHGSLYGDRQRRPGSDRVHAGVCGERHQCRQYLQQHDGHASPDPSRITRARCMRTSSASTARRETAICITTVRGTPGWWAASAAAAATSTRSMSPTPASARPGNFSQANASSIVIGEWYSSLTYAVTGHRPLQLDGFRRARRISTARTSGPAARASARPTAFRRSGASTTRL